MCKHRIVGCPKCGSEMALIEGVYLCAICEYSRKAYIEE